MSRDAVVIGGGLAGASVATLLARAGRSVTLIEQNRAARHKVCGEFLSQEAVMYLRRLGIDPIAMGAVPVTRLRFAAGGQKVDLELPFPALSLTRKALDECLLSIAAAAGAEVVRGKVEKLEHDGSTWKASLHSDSEVAAKDAFLATGKHDLRGHARGRAVQNEMIAFKQYFRLATEQHAGLNDFTELHMFPGGYAGLQPVENGVANLCLVIQRAKYRRLGSQWSALLAHLKATAPFLREKLEGATGLLERPLALSGIPYGYIRHRRAASVDGLWHLGDQTAVIPSLTGDGMSIALHTAHKAAEVYLAGKPAATWDAQVSSELRRQMFTATALSLLVTTPGLPPILAGLGNQLPGVVRWLVSATRIQPSHLSQPSAG